MRFLISGGNGFLGSNVVRRALLQGFEVTVIDDMSTMQTNNLSKDVTLIKRKIEEFKSNEKFDFVLHFAARPSPEDYIKHPVETILSNSVGTINMLNITRQSDAVFLYTSSSEVYGNASVLPTPETYFGYVNPNGIRSCYDEGKRYSEALIMAYYREYNIDVRIERPFNVYGPGIRPDGLYGRVIPRFILSALKGDDITIFGDGSQTRSFLFIDDWLDATWKLLNTQGLSGEIFNVGSVSEITINSLAKTIIDLTGSHSRIVHLEPREDDPFRRSADITKIKKRLRWEPRISLNEGLEKTIQWIRGKYA
jgi:UDP-glucuronate decarboxylase